MAPRAADPFRDGSAGGRSGRAFGGRRLRFGAGRGGPIRVGLAKDVVSQDGEVVLAFPSTHQFALRTADSASNRELLESVLGQAVGTPVRVRLEVAAAGADPQPAAAAAEPDAVDENDLLTELKEKFDAREIEERT